MWIHLKIIMSEEILDERKNKNSMQKDCGAVSVVMYGRLNNLKLLVETL